MYLEGIMFKQCIGHMTHDTSSLMKSSMSWKYVRDNLSLERRLSEAEKGINF